MSSRDQEILAAQRRRAELERALEQELIRQRERELARQREQAWRTHIDPR